MTAWRVQTRSPSTSSEEWARVALVGRAACAIEPRGAWSRAVGVDDGARRSPRRSTSRAVPRARGDWPWVGASRAEHLHVVLTLFFATNTSPTYSLPCGSHAFIFVRSVWFRLLFLGFAHFAHRTSHPVVELRGFADFGFARYTFADRTMLLQGHARSARCQVVIASCRDDLYWASSIVRVCQVFVLEKCRNRTIDDIGLPAYRRHTMRQPKRPRLRTPKSQLLTHESSSVPPLLGAETIHVTNCGRESHAYLWFIVRFWEKLSPLVAFLQGDAHRHLSLATITTLPKRLQQLQKQPMAFVHLAGHFLWSAQHWPQEDNWSSNMKLMCDMHKNFSVPAASPAGSCAVWLSMTHAHFVAKRETIWRHPRSRYTNLLRLFETEGGECSLKGIEAVRLGVLMERSWSLVFGCTRRLTTCGHVQPGMTQSELFAQCPGMLNRSRLRAGELTALGAAAGDMAKAGERKMGCQEPLWIGCESEASCVVK